jgi:hypothetical protein
MVMRDGQQYGPYTLADLQAYVAAGNILLSDLVKSEGMERWVPVSQVIGSIPVPAAVLQQVPALPTDIYPAPPGLHWGILLAIDILTCGIFGWAWAVVQAVWVRKVLPKSNALLFVIVSISCFTISVVLQANTDTKAAGEGLNLVGLVFWLIGVFSMKSSIEEHYNSAEPINLQLSGVMTFFFNIIYFQYHFTQIVQMKKSQQLSLT